MNNFREHSRVRTFGPALLLGAPALVMIFGFIVLPSLLLCTTAFTTRSPEGFIDYTFTFANVARAMGMDGDGAGVRNVMIVIQSLSYAAPVSLLAVALGFPVAIWISARSPRTRNLALALVMIPLCLNIVIRAYAWILLLGQDSPLCAVLRSAGLLDDRAALYPSGFAVLIGMLSATLPFAILTLQSATDRIDWNLFDAAEDLYASRVRAWYHGVIKGCMPAIRTAFLLTFIPALGMFVVPDILGGAKSWMIGNLIQQQFGAARNWPYGSALSLLMMALIVPCMAALLRVRHRATEGSGQRRSGTVALTFSLFSGAFLYLPLVTILTAGFFSTSNGLSFGPPTVRWFASAFSSRDVTNALLNTLQLALVSTAISTVIGTMLAFALERHRMPRHARSLIEGALQLPLALPEVLLAVGIALALGLLRNVSDLFAPGMTSMILGHVAFQTAFVTITVRAGLVTLGATLEEAAADLFANPFGVLKRVTLPLIAPSVIAGAILAFTLSLEDFAISFITSSPDSTTLPVLLYGSIRRGITPQLHAISAMLITATAVLIFAALALVPKPTIKA